MPSDHTTDRDPVGLKRRTKTLLKIHGVSIVLLAAMTSIPPSDGPAAGAHEEHEALVLGLAILGGLMLAHIRGWDPARASTLGAGSTLVPLISPWLVGAGSGALPLTVVFLPFYLQLCFDCRLTKARSDYHRG
jgi:hypothetical protein